MSHVVRSADHLFRYAQENRRVPADYWDAPVRYEYTRGRFSEEAQRAAPRAGLVIDRSEPCAETVMGPRWMRDMFAHLARLDVQRVDAGRSELTDNIWPLWQPEGKEAVLLSLPDLVAALERALPLADWGYSLDTEGIHFYGVHGLVQLSLLLGPGEYVPVPILQLPDVPNLDGFWRPVPWYGNFAWEEAKLVRVIRNYVSELRSHLVSQAVWETSC